MDLYIGTTYEEIYKNNFEDKKNELALNSNIPDKIKDLILNMITSNPE